MEKSMLEMTDQEILEHVRSIVKRREEQTVEKAVRKTREAVVKTAKKALKIADDPGSKLLLDFFNEEKKKK
jgi:hypothetical protein